jgi:hypothetical protein
MILFIFEIKIIKIRFMLKTTLKFNKSFLPLLFLYGGLTVSAQCPDNITVNNDEGECGAAVTFSIEGSGAGNSINGVVNPVAANGTTGWTVTNGGSGWLTTGGQWISSYSNCTMSQVVDLTTMSLTDAYMDTQPAITVSEQYVGIWPNFSDVYSMTVQLRGEADNIIATYTTGNITCTATQQTASHVFTGYGTGVRKVYISHTGRDAEFWSGQYGAAITNASITVAVPTSTIVQTAGIESGEIFPIGTTTNTFEITDENDVTTTCSFDVTVNDADAPVAAAQEIIIVELDETGTGTLAANDVNNGSTDNCTNLTYSVDIDTFTCEDLGENTINFSVSDGTNTTTIPVTVNVVDVISPEVTTQNITVELDENGVAAITPEQVDNESTDNCTITFALSKSTFDCSEVGDNTITFTATDSDGNEATGTAVVTVEDATAPTVITQNITIQLPQVTVVAISALDINNGSFDNCGISSYSLDNQVFTCENIGENTVVLSVTDNYGNVSTETATVTIEDPNNYCQLVGLDKNLADAVNIYPNPAKDFVIVEAADYQIKTIEVYDINAKLVKSFDTQNSAGLYSADISLLNSGLYIFRLISDNGIGFKKIIKE